MQSWKKNTALFLGGQALSLFGSMLVKYAIGWYITLETQSGAMLTIAVITGFAPTFFISPFGGVLADRYNRKYLINISDAVVALASLALALLFMAGYKFIWLLFICAAISAIGTGIQTPAVSAFIPQITPREHLQRVNSINSTIQSIAMLASPVLSGALFAFASIEALFFIDVITAAIGISIVFFFVKVPPPQNDKNDTPGKAPYKASTGKYLHELKDGFIYVWNHAYIRQICFISACFLFAAAPVSFLTPLQVARDFGPDIWRLTAVEIVFLCGMTIGGIVLSVWSGFKNKAYSMAVSCAVFGLCSAMLGITASFPVYLVCMGILGLVMPLYNAPSMTLLQTNVEDVFMGRVFGVFTMISSIMMPLGMLIFGPLGDIIKIDILLIGTGIFIFFLSFVFITSKTIRRAGRGGTNDAQLEARFTELKDDN
jgi:DHA3 family macrolide efflux protein-like MFS transporter